MHEIIGDDVIVLLFFSLISITLIYHNMRDIYILNTKIILNQYSSNICRLRIRINVKEKLVMIRLSSTRKINIPPALPFITDKKSDPPRFRAGPLNC